MPDAAPISTARAWWLASRPKTLSAAFAPVAVGTALAVFNGVFAPLPALAALAGALLIQIGTNFANDLLDFRRGADTAERLGPTRVTQAGLLSPRAVAAGTGLAFGLATLVGLYLVAVGGRPILVIGVASIVSGILYTAGPYPLAYVGLGDLFVMGFFGIVATSGTYYVQAGAFSPQSILCGIAVGAMSVAILVVNNLRDIETDRRAGKHTLPVRIGDALTRRYYSFMIGLAFVLPLAMSVLRGTRSEPAWGLGPAASLVLLALPFTTRPLMAIRTGATGAALNPVLGLTARAQVAHAAALCLGILLDAFLAQWMP
ncbi:MAG: 1,4-dihydroxy-2-naphthoate polyprenyltransferase [Caldilineae bacterium]|nr:1,4-dihydroxy-2-naphthoate polyprenyltransferase [Chloroflexota bacterium]MCB9176310.1 1,4-dihydroxy-2-naphthoate polyprenyltransferase [Caldilineae bacterium]